MNYNNNEEGDDDEDNFDFDLDATDDFFNTADDQMDSEFTAIADHYIANTQNKQSNEHLSNNSIITTATERHVNFDDDNDHNDEYHRHKFARIEQPYPSHTEPLRQAHSNTASHPEHSHEQHMNSATNRVVEEDDEDRDVEATFHSDDMEFEHDGFGSHDDMGFSDLHNEERIYSTSPNAPLPLPYVSPSSHDDDKDDRHHRMLHSPNKPTHSNVNTDNIHGTTSDYAIELEAPPFIENVQSYLPSVAPNAFPVIVAVLAQANLHTSIDLCELSCATRNVEFVPTRRAASATMRLHEPSAVILIRSSGAMSIIGSASISEARQAAELAARIIRKALNLHFDTFQFRVRSLMARFNVCSPIRLEALARYRMSETDPIPGVGGVFGSYEPERFSGCIVRIVGNAHHNRWSVSCTVFVTGKVTMLGARSEYELRFAFDALVPILAKFAVPLRDEVHS